MTAAVVALVFVVGFVATSRAPRAQGELPMAKAESVGMSTKRLERVHAYIQEYIDNNMIAGAVTLVARKGKVVHYEAQGFRYKEENQPMQKDTIFELMSMTKPIVSTALMMLWEDGKFMLDDPISKWLPNYAHKQVMENGKLVEAKPVTIRQILTHTSGLSLTGAAPSNVENALLTPDQRAAANAQTAQRQGAAAATTTGGAATTGAAGGATGGRGAGRGAGGGGRGANAGGAANGEGSGRARTLAEAVDRAANIPLLFQPGSEWRYGDSTDFVAILVEKISGMPIDEFLRKRIFEPLNMRDTFYNIPKEKMARVAAVYRPDANNGNKIALRMKPEDFRETTMFRGIAGLHGTAADYWRFCQMLLNGGELDGQRLLGRMTVDMMFANHITKDKTVYIRGLGYGFGLGAGVLIDPSKAPDALSPGTWSWGGADGTIFWIDPTEELIPIMMIQINPYSHFNIRPLFSVVASQAITDSLAGQKPKVMGYETNN
jgi:CubicO group peptidase (beta-lactamase class C family)